MIDEEFNQEIIQSDKPIKDLTYLFNENHIKQSMLRAQRLSSLQDKVVDKVEKRIDTKPDNFTNAELLNAINILQKANNDNLNYINSINEKPQIQLVNNTVSVNVENNEFSQESREKIMNAVAALLSLGENISQEEVETPVISTDFEDKTESEDNN